MSLAEALTESAVNVAHVAQSLRGEAEFDPSTGQWYANPGLRSAVAPGEA